MSTAVPYGTSAAAPPPLKTTSGKAIASLVCSIVGLIFAGVILGPVAICLAVSAKNEISERPEELEGECLATTGLIIGIIGFILSIILIIAIAS